MNFLQIKREYLLVQSTIACYGARVQSGEKKFSFKKTYSLTIYFQNIPNIDKKKNDKSQKILSVLSLICERNDKNNSSNTRRFRWFCYYEYFVSITIFFMIYNTLVSIG